MEKTPSRNANGTTYLDDKENPLSAERLVRVFLMAKRIEDVLNHGPKNLPGGDHGLKLYGKMLDQYEKRLEQATQQALSARASGAVPPPKPSRRDTLPSPSLADYDAQDEALANAKTLRRLDVPKPPSSRTLKETLTADLVENLGSNLVPSARVPSVAPPSREPQIGKADLDPDAVSQRIFAAAARDKNAEIDIDVSELRSEPVTQRVPFGSPDRASEQVLVAATEPAPASGRKSIFGRAKTALLVAASYVALAGVGVLGGMSSMKRGAVPEEDGLAQASVPAAIVPATVIEAKEAAKPVTPAFTDAAKPVANESMMKIYFDALKAQGKLPQFDTFKDYEANQKKQQAAIAATAAQQKAAKGVPGAMCPDRLEEFQQGGRYLSAEQEQSGRYGDVGSKTYARVLKPCAPGQK